MVQICILTNDRHTWLLRGFAYCFNKFYNSKQRVSIYGFNHPDFALPGNFDFVSLDDHSWPAQRWSTALRRMCNLIEDDYFILMLEDYWLTEKVDIQGIKAMLDFIKTEPKALRVDLSGNRAAYVQSQYYDIINGYEIVQTPMHTPYQMSFQAAIWNRKLLLSVLKEDDTPWEAEVNGSARLRENDKVIILGAKDTLLNYKPVYRTKGHKMLLGHIPQKLLNELSKRQCLNKK